MECWTEAVHCSWRLRPTLQFPSTDRKIPNMFRRPQPRLQQRMRAMCGNPERTAFDHRNIPHCVPASTDRSSCLRYQDSGGCDVLPCQRLVAPPSMTGHMRPRMHTCGTHSQVDREMAHTTRDLDWGLIDTRRRWRDCQVKVPRAIGTSSRRSNSCQTHRDV